MPGESHEQVCQSIIINGKLTFSVNYFEVTMKIIGTHCSNCGLLECGKMWQNVGRYGKGLAKQDKRLTFAK